MALQEQDTALKDRGTPLPPVRGTSLVRAAAMRPTMHQRYTHAMPSVRTDIVEVFAFRRSDAQPRLHFLQLHRAKGALAGTWQPVMGHIEAGETATQAALRELKEETGLAPPMVLAAWQLEPVNTYFLASADAIMHSPGFAVEIAAGEEPVLDDSHDALRWVPRDAVDRAFFWPGQRDAIAYLVDEILATNTIVSAALRVL